MICTLIYFVYSCNLYVRINIIFNKTKSIFINIIFTISTIITKNKSITINVGGKLLAHGRRDFIEKEIR